MRNKLLIFAALAVVMLQFGCAPAVVMSGGNPTSLVRPDCYRTDEDCVVPVYVSVTADKICLVQVPFDVVTVAKGKRPRIVWKLEPLDPKDGFLYQFDQDLGIVIVDNNPATDFDQGGPRGDDKFVWRSANKRASPKTFKYSVAVQRRINHHAAWSSCPVLDPKIINSGN